MLTFMVYSFGLCSCPGRGAARSDAPQSRDLMTAHLGPGSAASQVCRAAPGTRKSNPRRIELRLLAGAVAAQRTLLADRIGTLEDPVLPGGETGENLGFHGLGSDEAQIRFHAGETIGREAGALLEEHPDFVVLVDVIERKGHEPERLGFLGVERFADPFACAMEIGRLRLEARFKPRQSMAHRIGGEIQRGKFDRGAGAVVALARP